MPYRTPAEMPEEKEEVVMSDTVRIWKMVLTAGAFLAALIVGHSIFTTVYTARAAIQKAEIESSPMARDAAQARYLEAKALSDRAMFEEMAKHPAPVSEKK